MASTLIEIRNVVVPTATVRDDLCRLLTETVEDGASVGFLAPVQRATAEKYWKGVFDSLGAQRMLWVAEEGGIAVGSVQLELCGKENGLHRAEVQKLFVLPSHRGQGIARKLMDELEAFARSQGRTLLVLDTLAGSAAETVYQRMGWQRAGQIPKFAADPWGSLFPTVFYYKEI
ncbi:MAG TPA: GNAT family N-acetyltransferase [Usitatibacter sp.]|nr:GNAT family N-acetyltransferase [Usitatibacter sp.]